MHDITYLHDEGSKVIQGRSVVIALYFRIENFLLQWGWIHRDTGLFNYLFCLFQDLAPRCPIQPRRLLPVVGAKELCGQGAIQDHDACSVQRTTLLPSADVGVP